MGFGVRVVVFGVGGGVAHMRLKSLYAASWAHGCYPPDLSQGQLVRCVRRTASVAVGCVAPHSVTCKFNLQVLRGKRSELAPQPSWLSAAAAVCSGLMLSAHIVSLEKTS